MGVIPPWAMDIIRDDEGNIVAGPEYPGAALRRIFAGFLSDGDLPTRARPGVLSGGEVVVLDDVAYIGQCLVVVNLQDGSFVTGLDSEAEVPLTARDATNPRRDRVVVQVHHTAEDRHGEVRVIPGVAAPTPQPPATPTGAESLGVIEVPADGGGSAVFTPGQRYTAARGGIIAVPDQAALGRIEQGTPTHPVFATQGGMLRSSVGDGWGAVPYSVETGRVSISGTGGPTALEPVTFSPGRFTAPPTITLNAFNTSFYHAFCGSVTSQGFNAAAFRYDRTSFTGNVTVDWQAIQMTP